MHRESHVYGVVLTGRDGTRLRRPWRYHDFTVMCPVYTKRNRSGHGALSCLGVMPVFAAH